MALGPNEVPSRALGALALLRHPIAAFAGTLKPGHLLAFKTEDLSASQISSLVVEGIAAGQYPILSLSLVAPLDRHRGKQCLATPCVAA